MALSLICNTSDLNQRDRCVLEIGGQNRVVYIKLKWHNKISKWMMSLFDENNSPVLRNIPLVSARGFPAADLLNQFQYLDIGHAEIAPFQTNPVNDNPSSDNLGPDMEWGLLWGLPDGV